MTLSITRGDADIAAVAGLLGDRSRCRMLLALADGRCLPASMLAAEAGVSSSTASSHLGKLADAGLVTAQVRGRFRYYSLAGPGVADLIENLAGFAPHEQVSSLRAGTRAAALRRARTCYDHLAGRLGVALTKAMHESGWLDGMDVEEWAPQPTRFAGAADAVTAVLTDTGRRELARLGVDLPASDGVRCCIDWTEQRPHIAGRHGRAVVDRLLELDWIRRTTTSRAVQVTDAGERGLRESFGCALDERPPRYSEASAASRGSSGELP